MMLEIAIIEEMRTTVLEVLKRCHKPYSTFFFAAFVPFDSVLLATLRFELSQIQKRIITLQNF